MNEAIRGLLLWFITVLAIVVFVVVVLWAGEALWQWVEWLRK